MASHGKPRSQLAEVASEGGSSSDTVDCLRVDPVRPPCVDKLMPKSNEGSV